MSDLSQRLRECAETEYDCDQFSPETVSAMEEAADALDRLRAEVARLRMALEYVSDHDPDKPGLHGEMIDILRSAVAGAKSALATNILAPPGKEE